MAGFRDTLVSTMSTTNAALTLRPIAEHDLDAVLRVQAACYPPAMQEGAAVILSRIRAASASSFIAEWRNQVCAYVFAYRSVAGAISPLDAPFKPVPAGDTLYIHDLSVAPEAGGGGLARRLVAQLHRYARDAGLARGALVSVQESHLFWQRLGYVESACRDEAARQALASYPAPAVYMTHEHIGAERVS